MRQEEPQAEEQVVLLLEEPRGSLGFWRTLSHSNLPINSHSWGLILSLNVLIRE